MTLRCHMENLGELAAVAGPRIVRLSEAESRHARLARRLSAGDPLMLFDGQGREACGTLTLATKSAVEASVGEILERPRPTPTLTLAVAMPKGPRQDVLIEKCTELGVAAIQPLLTERSVAGASDHKRDKWRRATIEAAKQSGQCWLPELLPPIGLDECLASLADFDLAVVAMLSNDSPPVRILDWFEWLRTAATCIAFVGPEGGWSPSESEALIDADLLPVSLGPNVLRIETAAISIAAVAHACARVADM